MLIFNPQIAHQPERQGLAGITQIEKVVRDARCNSGSLYHKITYYATDR